MGALVAMVGALMILIVLWDAFETIVLPRRVTRRFRLAKSFYVMTWVPWSAVVRRIRKAKRREAYLSIFGPMSLLMLLSVWAVGLILGFAMLHWAIGVLMPPPGGRVDTAFATSLYLSGTTFFTLGLGDVVPLTRPARIVTVLEAGIGFGFLALIIGYLPVLYQSFSRREVNISLLDARAGTPPTAAELLRRHSEGNSMPELDRLLHDWESWSADLMESHLSYPVLCYFRSQHDNQSWVSALTTILDTCALAMVGVDGVQTWQAQLTFKIARHAVVDLAQIFNTPPRPPTRDRLGASDLAELREILRAAGAPLREGIDADQNLSELRHLYEPYVGALSQFLVMSLPPWHNRAGAADNWQTSAWERTPRAAAASIKKCAKVSAADDGASRAHTLGLR